MPEFTFAGPGEHVYPETRDAAGIPVGAVKPGDRREFDAAPDGLWVAADGGDGDPPADGEDPGCEDGAAEGDAPAPQPGQPVPPAVIPQ